MNFIDADQPLTKDQIAEHERELGLVFPASLKDHYLRANGGRPDVCLYRDPRDENVGVIVSDCLPLGHGKHSANAAYKHLVLSKAVVPRTFFPFAVDPGGDVLFVDASTADAQVYLWHHDLGDDEPIVRLNLGLEEFWLSLKPDPYLPAEEK